MTQAAQAPTGLYLPAVTLTLQPGEWYAGAVINPDGLIKHHVIAAGMRLNTARLTFGKAQKWAADSGLSAPTCQEARLIVAHHAGRLDDLLWFWTCEEHSSAFAWNCYLDDGDVFYDTRSAQGGAVAVRRVNP